VAAALARSTRGGPDSAEEGLVKMISEMVEALGEITLDRPPCWPIVLYRLKLAVEAATAATEAAYQEAL
jgi:hypothetical protein